MSIPAAAAVAVRSPNDASSIPAELSNDAWTQSVKKALPPEIFEFVLQGNNQISPDPIYYYTNVEEYNPKTEFSEVPGLPGVSVQTFDEMHPKTVVLRISLHSKTVHTKNFIPLQSFFDQLASHPDFQKLPANVNLRDYAPKNPVPDTHEVVSMICSWAEKDFLHQAVAPHEREMSSYMDGRIVVQVSRASVEASYNYYAWKAFFDTHREKIYNADLSEENKLLNKIYNKILELMLAADESKADRDKKLYDSLSYDTPLVFSKHPPVKDVSEMLKEINKAEDLLYYETHVKHFEG